MAAIWWSEQVSLWATLDLLIWDMYLPTCATYCRVSALAGKLDSISWGPSKPCNFVIMYGILFPGFIKYCSSDCLFWWWESLLYLLTLDFFVWKKFKSAISKISKVAYKSITCKSTHSVPRQTHVSCSRQWVWAFSFLLSGTAGHRK